MVETARGARRLVLVVEDDAVINQSLTDRLVAEGYDVERAFDGPGALTRAAARPPDVVVLDVIDRKSVV